MQNPADRPDRSLRMLVVGIQWPSRPFIDDLLLGLADRGVHVTIAAPAGGETPPSPLRALRVPSSDRHPLADPVALGQGIARSLARPVSSGRLFARTRRFASGTRDRLLAFGRCLPALAKRWDVVYMPWSGSLTTYRALAGGGTPVVASCRGTQIHVARHNPARAARFASMMSGLNDIAAVHCVSADLGTAVETLGVDRRRIRLIRTGVDTSFFHPPDSRDQRERLEIVSVGGLNWKKGHEYALVALRRLLDAGAPARLTLVGDGPDRQRLLYTAGDLGLEDRVAFRGALGRAAVREVLNESDVFLLSSLTEGISNAALEAMACGLPIVSTTAGGMPEAISDGEEGLLTPLRDPRAMAEALRALWLDAERRTVMGRAARRRVEADFDRESQLGAFAALLREVVDRAASRRVRQ